MSITTAGLAKLPRKIKILYGFGDWGNTTTSTIFGFFFSFFLTDIARLDPLYAAPVLLIGGIWDAINDPLIGVFADRVRTRWGRRRPFFLFTAIPFALTFSMLFWTPPLQSMVAKAIYYAIFYILFDTTFTLMTVPYSALTAELSEDYDERTSLTGYRMAVSMAGGLIAAIALPIAVDAFAEKATGYFVSAAAFGVLAIVPYLMLFAFIREKKAQPVPEKLNIFKEFGSTLRNRPFRYVIGVYVTAWVAVALVAALFQYYVTYWMQMPDQLEIMLGLVQGSALIFIPVMVFLSGKLGKQKAYIIGLVWWAGVMLVLAFLSPQARTAAYILAGMAGFGVAAAHVIPWAMMPDVIEQDELEHGTRREATFYGFMVFVNKSGTAAVLAMIQLVLHWSGYIPNGVQPTSALLAIRMMIGPFAAILLVISMVFAWRFPINRKSHEAIRNELAAKRAALSE
jgi:glycoside/pentoside/hexuronide:cation symporter, GPH family